MMKRWIAGAAVLCLLTAGGAAMACGHGRGLNYVDADRDGVCDNRTTSVCRYDADGDGVCDHCGGGYVDANGDGICDHCTGTGLGSYAHHGYGHGHGCK